MSFKILHLLTSLEIGGAQIARLNLIKELIKQRPEYTHYLGYCYKGPLLEDFKHLTKGIFETKGWVFRYDPGAILQIQSFIKNNGINIVHSGLWASNYLTKIVCKTNKIPSVLDLHCKKDLLSSSKLLLDLFNKAPESCFYTPVSKAVAESFEFKNFKIINNGIDKTKYAFDKLNRYKIRQQLSIDEKVFVFGGIGRLEKEKNFSYLIKSFHEFLKNNPEKRAVLLIIGSGSELEIINNLVKMLKIEDFCKIIPAQKNIKPFYDAIDTIVFTSETEGLPMVAIEGMANGLPVLMPEHLRQEELSRCLYFAKNQLPELMQNVSRISDLERPNKLSKNFEIYQTATNFIKIYEALITKFQVP